MNSVKRAERFPCPYCGETSGFTSQKENAADLLKGLFVGVAGMAMHPKKFIPAFMSSNTGDRSTCRACGEKVSICQLCDHPNRAIGAITDCSHCGKPFLP